MPSPKFTLPFLEMMATQVCNLSCLGCSNYSDLQHRGYVSWAEAQNQIKPWLEILNIPDFGIIGGEPLINPEIKQWIIGIRELLPSAQIRFTTNGLLLSKHPDLLETFDMIGNCVFKITVHTQNVELENYINSIIHNTSWEPVIEFGIKRWRNKKNVRIQLNRPDRFLKTYKNDYADMKPYDNDPVLSFANCIQQTCPLLYDGRIYKCSTAGLLEKTLQKVGSPNQNLWEPYIDPGISVQSSNDDIKSFIKNFGLHNTICRQCPTANDTTLDHKITVLQKINRQQ
jgi:organic radical activating enzyme